MITKEELINTCIKYSSDITEEIFDKIIDKLEDLGFEKYSNSSRNKEYEHFVGKSFPYLRIDCKYWFIGIFDADYKEIQVSDVLENNQFVLPGKWCVKSTNDTIKVINDFINSKGYGATLSYNYYYIHYPFLNGTGAAYNSIQHGYTEITFDQFKQHVLKERVKKIKYIEKWYVGSYIVPLQDRLLSRTNLLTKGKPYEIIKLILGHIPYIIDNNGDEINFKTDFKDVEATQGIKWFPTLAEAEAFSKSLLEPKPLTVDDLVEGEIYYFRNNSGEWILLFEGNIANCKTICKDRSRLYDGDFTVTCIELKLATPEEKKWLLTCIKQDEFIEQSELDKYDSEGNLIQVKPTFEFNKWYKVNNADGLFFIQSKNTGYGFRSNHKNIWIINNGEYEWNLEGIVLATNEEVEERLISYAKENYSKNDNYRCLFHKDLCSIRLDDLQITEKLDGVVDSDIGYIFYNGQWAEVISKPETKESKEMQLSDLKNPVFNVGDKVRVIADSLKEFNNSWSSGNNTKHKKGYEGIITSIDGWKSNFKEVTTWYYLDGDRDNAISCNLLKLVEPVKKEFDRNWYVKVNSQEEADKVFDWLESQDENTFRGHACFNKTFKYIRQWNNASSEYHNKWFLSSEKNNKPQKQLSDILPNYSSEPKVDRNVYYEVSNQEQYEEILDWLKNTGEEVIKGSRVIENWKYIYKDNAWCLYNIKPNLPKANFTFKNKQKCTFNEGIVIKKEEKPIIEKKLISKVKKSIEF